ncbi:hypothetical protein AVEN_43433-1 [Araneus ventricosus]|uniref:Uncharacterized protein n=1 Tax=Araneus ventricosus TaxID=182803 RepID=A0A4Y2WHL5_ARAVE|nr:hypothetical protein AVEN_43433-1 [Araneus ventricosus]
METRAKTFDKNLITHVTKGRIEQMNTNNPIQHSLSFPADGILLFGPLTCRCPAQTEMAARPNEVSPHRRKNSSFVPRRRTAASGRDLSANSSDSHRFCNVF